MSIIHDALKKAQSARAPAPGGATGSPSSAPPRPLSFRILAGVSLAVAVLALGVTAWRVLSARSVRISSPAGKHLPPPPSASPPPLAGRAVPDPAGGRLPANEGEKRFAMGDFVGAEALFRKALAAGGGDRSELENNLGLSLKRQGRDEEALRHFDEALRLRPDLPQGLNNRGVLLRRMGKVQKAEKDLKRALALLPTYGVARLNLAFLLESGGRKREAMALYRDLLSFPGQVPGLDEAVLRRRVDLLDAELALEGWTARQGEGQGNGGGF